jgi:hypothetical protein
VSSGSNVLSRRYASTRMTAARVLAGRRVRWAWESRDGKVKPLRSGVATIPALTFVHRDSLTAAAIRGKLHSQRTPRRPARLLGPSRSSQMSRVSKGLRSRNHEKVLAGPALRAGP